MKKRITITILAVLFSAGTALKGQEHPQEYLGLPGDNLNLYAVMKLFQESKTLEGFEKSLNDPANKINNLDLNGDNLVDYITVHDKVKGNVHNIVLRDAINKKESQDVAVFTVQRFPNGQVQIQLTGDEALYGKNYIIEPITENSNPGETPNPGYEGDNTVVNGQNVTIDPTTPYIIASWPLVSYLYGPDYVPWDSWWYWGYYPSYWYPWRPYYWDFYFGFFAGNDFDYYSHYRRCDVHRYSHWNDYYYTSRRVTSPSVYANLRAGVYNTTYSHPEQRAVGEAQYRVSHPDMNLGTSYSGRRGISTGERRIGNTISANSSSDRRFERSAGSTMKSTSVYSGRSFNEHRNATMGASRSYGTTHFQSAGTAHYNMGGGNYFRGGGGGGRGRAGGGSHHR